MQLTDTVIAAVVGALAAVLTSLAASWVRYRALRADYLGKYRMELISKQMAACEALWRVLEPGSRSHGQVRVIVNKNDKHYASVEVAEKLYGELTQVFNSPSGLYFSRQLRESLFELRDFIGDEFLKKAESGNTELEISNNKAKSFHGRLATLRIALRKEIGTEDLVVSKEGPAKNL
jgi:hypothetical protein